MENIYLELLDESVEDDEKTKIILIGSTEECENTEKYINTEKCHIVGYMYSVEEILQMNDIDYFLVCGDLKKIDQPDTRIIWRDLLQHCYWRISPETAYMRQGLDDYVLTIEKLKNEKNLQIDDEAYAKEILRRTSYYSLIGGYKDILLRLKMK